MNKITLLIVFILVSITLNAQKKYKKLDSLLTTRYQNEKFSGVVIVAEGNQITYANALGYADYKERTPLNLSTQFDLSSGSKLFTAIAVAQLIEQNKLSFESKVKEFFPELTLAAEINVHQLMTHSSGLGNFQTAKGFSYQNANSCIDLLPFIKDQSLRSTPGTKAYYATSNLLVLGAIVEKISGMSFPKYVEKNIINKIDLKRTTFDTYYNVQDYADRDGRFARGYIKNKKGVIVEKNRYKRKNTFVTLSAGGMWVSAMDLLKFNNALYSGKFFRKKLLKQMLQHHMFSGWEGTYFGHIFHIVNVNTPKEGTGHAGNSSGHHSFNFHYNKKDTTLIILTNYGFVDIFELAHEQIERILFD
jgi:CubicO group peptidase (beta-lactamase class C family)